MKLFENCLLCQVQTHLEENGTEVRDYTAVSSDVALLAIDELDAVSPVKGAQTEVTKVAEKTPSETNKRVNGKHHVEENSNDRIWADPASCCYALYSKLKADKVLLQPSPLALAKALKVVHLYPLNKGHILFSAAQESVWSILKPTLHENLESFN